MKDSTESNAVSGHEPSHLKRSLVPPLTNGTRRPMVEEELRRWYSMNEKERLLYLQECAKGYREFSIEAFVHISRQAFRNGNRRDFNLAFEVLSKRATPLLLSQAWRLAREDRLDQAQEVLLQLFKLIKDNKADFAESQFAAFARRKAISLSRKGKARFESRNERIEPTEESDPIDDLSARKVTPEELTQISRSLDNLSVKHQQVFLQYHYLGMTQEEIAEHHGVTVRSVYNWLKSAEQTLGADERRTK